MTRVLLVILVAGCTSPTTAVILAPDAGADLAGVPDAAPDAPPDAPVDSPVDMAPDSTPDTAPDASPDLPPDLAPDTIPCVDVCVEGKTRCQDRFNVMVCARRGCTDWFPSRCRDNKVCEPDAGVCVCNPDISGHNCQLGAYMCFVSGNTQYWRCVEMGEGCTGWAGKDCMPGDTDNVCCHPPSP